METENLNNNEKVLISGILYTLDEIKADKFLLRKYKKKVYQKQYINNYMKEYNKKQKEKDIDGYRAKLNESKKKKYATNDEFRKKVLQKAKEYNAKKRGKNLTEIKKYRKFYMSDDGNLIEIID